MKGKCDNYNRQKHKESAYQSCDVSEVGSNLDDCVIWKLSRPAERKKIKENCKIGKKCAKFSPLLIVDATFRK